MSLAEFWRNAIACKQQIAPLAPSEAVLDLSADEVEKAQERAIHWLTADALDGFDEADYSFLLESERRALADQVGRFRAIATQAPVGGTPTSEQAQHALTAFLAIAEILEFHRYADPDAFRIGKQIEKKIAAHRPPELAELRFETGLDHTGDPGTWIWAILTDESAEPKVFPALTQTILEQLNLASRSVAPDRWPYVQFRTVSEQAELLEANAQ